MSAPRATRFYSSLMTHTHESHASLCVFNRLAPLLEHPAIPNESRARVGCQLKILRQLEAISGTRFLAQRAKHAARSVKDEFIENFLATGFARNNDFHVHRNHVDAIFRTRERAQVARDAKRVMRLRIHVQARRTMKPWRDIGSHFRILLGVDSLPGYCVSRSQRTDIKAQRHGHSL